MHVGCDGGLIGESWIDCRQGGRRKFSLENRHFKPGNIIVAVHFRANFEPPEGLMIGPGFVSRRTILGNLEEDRYARSTRVIEHVFDDGFFVLPTRVLARILTTGIAVNAKQPDLK